MIDVEKEIFSKFPKLQKNKLVRDTISKFAKSIIHQDEINKALNEIQHLSGFEFVDAVMDYFDFDFKVSQNSLQNIPSSGKVVIIANHPLGGLDGIAILKLVGKVRQDVKIIANDFLNGFDGLKPLMLSIDNFKTRQTKESLSNIYEALNNEQAVIIFPSGEVSRMSPTGVKDKFWHKGFLKFASRTSSPILPIYIDAKNSKRFYSISAINKKLSTLLLADEMFRQKSKSIEMHVGELIPNENIFPKGIKQNEVVNLYKKHLYSIPKKYSYFITQKSISHPQDRRYIKQELKESTLLGETKDGKKIYLYECKKDSKVLYEIGRLREISFRKVGEGTNKKRDIDVYDTYYKHIVLWDDEELEIVGAYRIAEVKDIIKTYGISGLYTSTLFTFGEKFDKYLDDSIELGRSFVQPKYWGSRALDYLWFGIGAYLKHNPQIKYMFGPVSLSASYQKTAKDIILYFYDSYYGSKKTLVLPKIPYNFKQESDLIRTLKHEFSEGDYKANFKLLKNMLSTFNVTVPTLYKQYADLCEEGGIEFCAYNVDKDFSDCVDSFILVKIDKIKEAQRKRYIDNNLGA
ncbi:lysophospholipid acyltransferase family protein [bacterium]|nr:lysophospholipid acyltransferase family protein [bacterium]MBU1989146.1 lysophospholipid acyltransferase family protein [bacterium]